MSLRVKTEGGVSLSAFLFFPSYDLEGSTHCSWLLPRTRTFTVTFNLASRGLQGVFLADGGQTSVSFLVLPRDGGRVIKKLRP